MIHTHSLEIQRLNTPIPTIISHPHERCIYATIILLNTMKWWYSLRPRTFQSERVGWRIHWKCRQRFNLPERYTWLSFTSSRLIPTNVALDRRTYVSPRQPPTWSLCYYVMQDFKRIWFENGLLCQQKHFRWSSKYARDQDKLCVGFVWKIRGLSHLVKILLDLACFNDCQMV